MQLQCEPINVLLVEEDPDEGRRFAQMLRNVAGARIALTQATHVSHALGSAPGGGFNAILLDVSLSDGDGMKTFAAAKAVVPAVPIIVLVAFRDEAMAARVIHHGAQDYLVKGHVDGTMLDQAIHNAIERHHYQESLRASESNYRGLVDGSRQAILIEAGGTIRLANPALARLLGFDGPDACLGASLSDFIAAEDQERVQELMQACIAGRPAPMRYECNFISRKGTRGSLDCIVSAMQWEREPAILVAMVDITERKRAEQVRSLNEEQLRHSQKMEAVGRLANGVAHDFNNLLTVIMRYTELLLREADTGHPVTRSDLHEIHNAASTAFTLMSQLVALSPKRVLDPKVLSLNNVVAASESLLRRTAGTDVDVHITLDPATPRVRADAGQLEQVLLNLVVNARDAMPDGGDLRIETSTSEVVSEDKLGETASASMCYSVVTVRDTGIGMDAETQTRIFEPFFTTKPFGKGLGLGLATVYGIVTQSGGMVKVDSAVGRGATLSVYLPRVSEAADMAVPMPSGTSIVGSETLLLVEDAVAVRRVLSRALERFGYTILEAPDGQTALAIASRHHANIDLLLTNAVLPELSGRHLAERLREVRPELRVIFMSGFAGDIVLRSGELEAWASYLQKPFTPRDLARKVREVLDVRERGHSKA